MRIGEAIALAATSAVLLSGDTARPTLEQMAPDARVAIAERYVSCGITDVDFDTTTRKAGDGRPRNDLIASVAVAKTAEALRYEHIYAEDDTVMWDEPVGGAAFIDLGDKKNAQTEFGLGLPVIEQEIFGTGMNGEAATGRFEFVPRNDYRTGDRMDIYATNHTMTYDFDNRERSEAVGFTYCGTLEATSDGDRVTEWTNLGHLPELASFVLTRECELTTEDGAHYRDECPDWQRVDQ